MPNTRMLLWFALAAILYFNYEAWTHDYPAPGTPGAAAQSAAGAPGTAAPQAASTARAIAPPATAASAPVSAAPAPDSFPAPPASAASAQDAGSPGRLRVTTDVLDIDINLKGGELDQADLKQYPQRKDTPNIPVRLLSRDPPYLLQTGLVGPAGEPAPTHLATWISAEKSFVLAPNAQELRVPMTWTDGQGLNVTKTFIFKRGLYSIDLTYH